MDQETTPAQIPAAPTAPLLPAQPGYPVRVEIDYPAHSSRLLALATLLLLIPKVLIVIPHFVVLYVLNIAAFAAFIIAQIAVLFTGRYPKGMFDFVTGTMRWQTRVSAYFLGLTDSYPPFSLH
jgi:hypothetical protein